MVSVVTMATTIRMKRRASRFMVTSGSSIAGGAQKCESLRAGLLNWERPVTIHPSFGPVAQLVEHVTFNHRVAGSSPARLTIIINGLQRASPVTIGLLWGFLWGPLPTRRRQRFHRGTLCRHADMAVPLQHGPAHVADECEHGSLWRARLGHLRARC